MKKVKMIDVYNSVAAFNTLLEMKMPVKTSAKILALVQEVNMHLKDAEKLRTDLVEKYGKKGKDGVSIVPDSKKQAFIDELNEMMLGKDIEIKSDLLTYEDFDAEFEISPSQLSLISYLIKD